MNPVALTITIYLFDSVVLDAFLVIMSILFIIRLVIIIWELVPVN